LGSVILDVTPTGDNLTANDIQILVRHNGIVVGQGQMTVVSVTIPEHIRNADTPAGMVDRIPPGATNLTPALFTVGPNLAGSGQSVRLSFTGQSAANGTAIFAGGIGDTYDITDSGGVFIEGTAQTAAQPFKNTKDPKPGGAPVSGRVGALKLVVQVRGISTVMSEGFSVAAIPIAVRESRIGTISTLQRTGIIVSVESVSDSDNNADLNAVDIFEVVNIDDQGGVFKNFNPEKQVEWLPCITNPPLGDKIFVHDSYFKDPGGILVESQLHLFRDARTGAANFAITNSGFAMVRRIFKDAASGTWRISISKVGSAVDIGAFSSAAGFTNPPDGIFVTLNKGAVN
jgi:hypothetical protein